MSSNNHGVAEILRSRARQAGLSVSTDRFAGGIPVHDDLSRYSIQTSGGYVRATAIAGLAIAFVGVVATVVQAYAALAMLPPPSP